MAVTERDEYQRRKPSKKPKVQPNEKPKQVSRPKPARQLVEGLDPPDRRHQAAKAINQKVASGETFGSWFLRRHSMLAQKNIPVPMQFILASSRMSDKELSDIGKAIPVIKERVEKKSMLPNPTMEGEAVGPTGITPQEWQDKYAHMTAEERRAAGIVESDAGDVWWKFLLASASLLGPVVPAAGGGAAAAAGATKIGSLALKAGLGEQGATSAVALAKAATFAGGVSGASGIAGGPDPVFEFTEEQLAARVAAGLDVGTSLIPGGRKPISFSEALENAREGGSGRSVAVALGVDPESGWGRGIAAGATILLHSKLSPDAVAAKAARAGSIAEKVPAADQLRRRSMLEQNVLRSVATERTEDLVFSAPGKLNRDSQKIFRDVKRYKENANAFLRLYSSGTGRNSAFDFSHFVDLKIAAEHGEEAFGDALASLMRGERPYTTRTMLAGRANTVQSEIDDIESRLAKIPEKDITGAKPKPRVQLEDELKGLKRRHKSLVKASEEQAFTMPVHGLPDATLFNEMRIKLRSGDKGFLASAGRILDKDWARKPQIPWFVRVPKRKLDLRVGQFDTGINDAREDLSRIGGLLRLKKGRTDHYVNQILDSHSDAERVDLYKAMLAEGANNFPSRLRDQVTQLYSNPGGSTYAIEPGGKGIKGWYRRRTTPLGDVTDYDQPLLVSQLAKEVPVPDPRALIEMQTWGGKARIALKGLGDGAFSGAVRKSKLLRVAAPKLADTWKGVNHVLSFVSTTVWAPLVLLRPGWTIKVTGEERIRMLMLSLPRHEAGVLSVFGRIKPGSLKRLIKEGLIPEDALTDVGRGMLGDHMPTTGVMKKGSKGWETHLQNEMVMLSQDPVLPRLLKTGKENTLAWLEGRGQRHATEMGPVLAGIEGGADLGKWLDKLEEVYVKSGRFSDEALEAIKTGKFNGIDLDSTRALEEFARHPGSLPSVIMQNGEFWRSSAGYLRRGANVFFEWAGSKPTNILNRSRMFQLVHTGEKRRYEKLGLPESLADEAAKRYAVKQIAEVLYESSERSANDLILRTISPFLPAWKEVLKTWTVTIPRSYGNPLIGHAVLARKLANVKEAFEENKILYKDSEDKWVVETPLGPVNPQAFNILGNWPIGGPVASVTMAVLSSQSKKFEDLLDPMMPFGADTNIGARNVNQFWVGHFGGRKIGPITLPMAPPWEVLSMEKQNQEIVGAQIMWLRTEGFERMSEIAKMPKGSKREQAVAELELDAERGAAGFFVQKQLKGLVLPFSPRHFWEGQKEHQDFMDSLGKVPADMRGALIDKWASDNPQWALYTVAKSRRIKGEDAREDSFDAYFADLRKGNIKTYTLQEWTDLALFLMNYSAAKAAKREKLAGIGTTAQEWLANAHEWREANAELSDEIGRLKMEFPKGYQIWDENLRRSRERKGLPIADAELQRAMDGARVLRDMQDQLLEIDPFADTKAFSEVKRFNRSVLDALDVDSYFTDPELKSGPDRETGLYFKNVVDPYWTKADEIRKQYIDKANPSTEDIQRGYLELQKHRNAWEAPEGFGGFPHPEEFSYKMLSPEQQQVKKLKWAASPPSFLTGFQRKELGIPDSPKVLRFWERVREIEIDAAAYIEKNSIQASSKEAIRVRGIVEDWTADLAERNGLRFEVNMGKALRYERFQKLGLLPASMDRSAEVAKAAWARLRSIDSRDGDGVGPSSGAGLPIFHAFVDWFSGQVANNPELARDLLAFNAAAPEDSRTGKKGWKSIGYRNNGLLAWLFFSD